MLISAERFKDTPIMSLQTGSELARTKNAIIDPTNLSIVAYELQGNMLNAYPSLLRIADIREIGPLGMIIDSADEIISPDDVIKIKKIYDYHFDLINKSVITKDKEKIGKVVGYTIDSGSFIIQQLRVHRPIFRSFSDTEILIHRSQIDNVDDDHVIIKQPTANQTADSQELLEYYRSIFQRDYSQMDADKKTS